MPLTIQELQNHIRRGPGLVLGPGLTTSGARERQCLEHLSTTFPGCDKDTVAETYLDYADLIFAKGDVSETKVRAAVGRIFGNKAFANPQLDALVRANWTVVVSLCSDDFFREKLADFLYATPTKWTVTTVAEPNVVLPLTTVPYYALMGDPRDVLESSRLAVSRSELLARQRSWKPILATMPHILKSDPLIFLGTAPIVDRVCDFVNELLKLQPQIPKRLIFLANDPTATNALFRNLVKRLCQVEVADCSLTDLGNYLSLKSLNPHPARVFAGATKSVVDPKAFAEIEDQVAYVPRADEVAVNPAERNRLLDTLFRPTHLDWGPYALNLQFKRDICSTIDERVKVLFKEKRNGPRIIHVRGEAGIGKTVVCRSVAFELAQGGHLCLWIKRSYGELSGSHFEAVVHRLNDSIKRTKAEAVFFLDDPAGTGVPANQAVSALARAQFPWVLVISSRKSDEINFASEQAVPPVVAENEVELPADFSEGELSRLPQYLVSLGVAASPEVAKNMMIPAGMRHSKDVLCSLWYLLPQTHAAIEDSLVGEYRRLGATEEVVRHFADVATGAKSVAKLAYELVTTTSGFESTPLPVEVLVSALEISYEEWSQQCKEQKPLWGLVYDEEYPSAETYAYRTRNHVVTEVLLRALNQGTSGHTGEFRCLKRLVSSCTSSTPQYKRFLLDILVDRRLLIEKRFNYSQALDLYDSALKAYPRALGVVEHQRAIVKRHLGGDAEEVYNDLRRLIAYTNDRAIPDQDSPDNLHTSAAAALNQLIKEKRADPVVAAEGVFEHISAALAHDQFSLHSHHVHASTLINIAYQLRESSPAGFMANLERAARIVGRATILAQHTSSSLGPSRSAQFFQDLKQEILLAHPNLEDALQEAIGLFEQTADQSGLAFVSRVLLMKAQEEPKGHQFKRVDDFLRKSFKLVLESKAEPCIELTLCRVELVINWHINLQRGPVDWEQFEADLQRLVRSPRHGADILWTFYLAVAEYNRGKFPDAEARFQSLRVKNLPWETKGAIRCYYFGDKSGPKTLEGKISHGPRDRYLYSGELGTDVLVRKGDFLERPDEVKHFKVGFSFYGPIAMDRNA